jgi:hypothetical protein
MGIEITLLDAPPYPVVHARAGGDLTIRMPRVFLRDLNRAWSLDRDGGTRPDHRDLPPPSQLCVVRSQAPAAMRRAVYTCARYFRREFRYDFVQYSEREEEPSARAFLWHAWEYDMRHRAEVWGACCFRWRTWQASAPVWALQWIWLHPYLRNQGLLSATWPYFLKRFGWFDVEAPYSPAMRAFLSKVGWVRPFVSAREA